MDKRDGRSKTAADWSREMGLEKHTVGERIKRGIPAAEAVSIKDFRKYKKQKH